MQLRTLLANWKNVLPWGLVVVFIILLSLQTYRSFEQAVTLGYEYRLSLTFQEQRDVLRILIEPFVRGFTKAQLINLLQKNKIKYFVNEYADPHIMDEIVAGQVAFCFDKNKMVRVEVDQNFDEISRRSPYGEKRNPG